MSGWKIDPEEMDRLISEVRPLWDMQDKIMKEISSRLAMGIPVTVTMGDRKLYTMYPCGKTEHHEGW